MGRDTGKEYIIDADLPGIEKKDMSIHFENEQLIISVNREEQTEEDLKGYLHRERSVESYERRINLKDVDPKAFKASLNNGVLTSTAPKLEKKINKYLIDIE